ncbi:type IV pilin protein [Accumulibacter sp.]|uniref:type IV pilin protein n=1 Tax=Accumulibacter sp. TaxID=2053492 RepID=UPI0025CDC41A|nr:prepilin-type N-terminal cleavage/methylation domain-containing protein [Accumulibacter sp.]MCM8595884.1 prepilin-type N-terminal cleavage/methylation domain-containing protein [Accumulibacter sp.]MCM8625673.1 prepilin-type N-terminal cleavage/methylation domain-containing protein [Accumulibacter sp.]MDS4050032.1 prepilin-type N-terminal cleavage/methylation domain-containing protein [Accumulibacter sp.]
MNKSQQDQRGFTLIEVMIIVCIVGILTSIATVQFSEYIKKGADKSAQADARLLLLNAVAASFTD